MWQQGRNERGTGSFGEEDVQLCFHSPLLESRLHKSRILSRSVGLLLQQGSGVGSPSMSAISKRPIRRAHSCPMYV